MECIPKSAPEVQQELQKAFMEGRQVSLQVTGTSMVPFLRHRKDWVLLRPLEGVPKVGQILLFSQGERLVLHRLRRKKRGYYIMNGDGQARIEVIRPEQVQAVACAVIRRSGRTIPCDSLFFRLAGALWYPTRPVRPQILWAAEKAKAWMRKRS